jgi:hypothetical protein
MEGLAHHGINQTLVAISEIGRKPSWCFGDGFVWPLAIRKVYRREGPVLLGRVFEPGNVVKEVVNEQKPKLCRLRLVVAENN